MQTTLQPIPKSWSRSISVLFWMLTGVYLLSCLTPLHIHFDSIRYYNIKDCIEFGCPPDSFPANDYLPFGYTFLLITLSKLGILNAVSIVLVNCFYLFGGIYFLHRIMPNKTHPLLPAVVLLLSWVVIKFTLHPLSEMQYIFFSMGSLFCFHQFVTRKNFVFLGLSFILAFATLLTRTVGVSLLGALLLGVLWQYREDLLRIIKKNKIIVVVLAAVGVILIFFARQLKILDYTSLLKSSVDQGGMGKFVGENLKNHLTELSEIFINLPSKKLASYMSPTVSTVLFMGIGLLVLVAFFYLLFRKSPRIPMYIKIYLVLYALIILNWPYYDPRFWVPVLPLMVIVVMEADWATHRVGMTLKRLYLGFVLFTGLTAAAYSLYTGFDKHRFATNHAAGDYRNEFETYFFGKPLSDTAKTVDPNVVEILKKYN